jgi:hypothetical protein
MPCCSLFSAYCSLFRKLRINQDFNLSLTLLVLGDFTDHANLAVTVNDLALVANLLD